MSHTVPVIAYISYKPITFCGLCIRVLRTLLPGERCRPVNTALGRLIQEDSMSAANLSYIVS